MPYNPPRFIAADEFHNAVPMIEAVEALEKALRQRDVTANSPLRTGTPMGQAQLLYMPAAVEESVGVKLLSVAPDNPTQGLPRIQGLYILFSARTWTPVALLDAISLTNCRTAALSAVAVRHLATPDAHTLLVFGSGPQAWAHITAITQVRPIGEVIVVGRSLEPTRQLSRRVKSLGMAVRVGGPHDVADADVVACCTSAGTPLFDSSILRREAAVVAMGSHSPRQREVDSPLLERATVIVETREAALAEAGDVVLAIAEGVPEDEAINGDLVELVAGTVTPTAGHPRLFKSVGQGWSDVVVARLAVDRLGLGDGRYSPGVARD